MEAWVKLAERLSSGNSAFVAWFLVVALATALVWMYRNTIPKEIKDEGIEKILANQTEIAKSVSQNVLATQTILDLVKDVIRDLAGRGR